LLSKSWYLFCRYMHHLLPVSVPLLLMVTERQTSCTVESENSASTTIYQILVMTLLSQAHHRSSTGERP
jgi:hypothetical protein